MNLNYDELMRMLDIEHPEDFSYFENMADLLESEESIEREAICGLLAKADKAAIAELIRDYIDDVCENVPSNEAELFTLLDTIKLSLSGMARQSAREDTMVVMLADELLRFRQWYSHKKKVLCTDKDDRTESAVTVAEAVALYRLEKIGEAEYDYDFSDVLDYPIDEYIIAFADLSDEDEEEYAEDFLYDDIDYDREESEQ